MDEGTIKISWQFMLDSDVAFAIKVSDSGHLYMIMRDISTLSISLESDVVFEAIMADRIMVE